MPWEASGEEPPCSPHKTCKSPGDGLPLPVLVMQAATSLRYRRPISHKLANLPDIQCGCWPNSRYTQGWLKLKWNLTLLCCLRKTLLTFTEKGQQRFTHKALPYLHSVRKYVVIYDDALLLPGLGYNIFEVFHSRHAVRVVLTSLWLTVHVAALKTGR